jgi:hypothetical protein
LLSLFLISEIHLLSRRILLLCQTRRGLCHGCDVIKLRSNNVSILRDALLHQKMALLATKHTHTHTHTQCC